MTQEYYSMPCYPALALLIGSALKEHGTMTEWGTQLLRLLLTVALICYSRDPNRCKGHGDTWDTACSRNHPAAYSLSLGHMEDLEFSDPLPIFERRLFLQESHSRWV